LACAAEQRRLFYEHPIFVYGTHVIQYEPLPIEQGLSDAFGHLSDLTAACSGV
jgi:hypothetical protein